MVCNVSPVRSSGRNDGVPCTLPSISAASLCWDGLGGCVCDLND